MRERGTRSGRKRSPRVTVVLAHSREQPVTDEVLAALDRAGWPGEQRDVVVVRESGSPAPGRPADGKGLSVVPAPDRAGIAAARNVGADAASAEYVAFLTPGAVPPVGWLAAAVDVFETDSAIACVAPAVAGEGTALSFAARPLAGAADAAGHDSDVLHPSTHAMVVRAGHFRDVGGFDERYERLGEEIDLGWRCWLLGYRVRGCPSMVVSTAGVAPLGLSPAHERFLRERNGLFTIFKNYDDRRLGVALPASMALCLRRGGLLGDEQLLASARAVDAFVAALDDLNTTRAELQAARQRTDQEVLRLFRSPLVPPMEGDAMAEAQRAVADTFRLEEHFGSRRRIVVATPDVLTAKMAGPAIRAWHIAAALAREHDVQLVTTSKLCDVPASGFTVRAVDDDDFEALEQWAEVLVLQGFILEGRPYLRSSRKVMIFDVYDPLHLEQLELARHEGDAVRRGTVLNATAVLNDQLARGDFFLCASGKQRDFWLGQMSALGRVNPATYDEDETLESLIGVVPFGLPEAAPAHARPAMKGVVPGIADDDQVILWAGGIYNWFDPLTLVRAVDRLKERNPKVRLFFMGLKHPNPDVREMRMAVAARELAGRLGLTGTHVFFNEGWVAYEDRQNYLLEADVGVSTHLDHVETAFSFRTRILDYFWAQLPIVATSGDAFAEVIEREALGLTVPAGDVEALEEALFRMLDDEEFAAVCRKNLGVVQARYTWPEVLGPLLQFCRSPRRAPDLVDPEHAPGEAAAASPLRPNLRRDVGVALTHLREGGVERLLRRAAARAWRVSRALR